MEPGTEPRPPFRINRQVGQMTVLLLLALALPITIIVLSVRGWSPRQAAPAPEVVELRQSVENIATEHFGDAQLVDGRREVAFSGNAEEMKDRRALIESAARKVGGSVLPGEKDWLVSVPNERAGEFEVAGLIPPANKTGVSGPRLYRITFSEQ